MILYSVFDFTTLSGALADSVAAAVQYGLAGAAIGWLASRGSAAPAA